MTNREIREAARKEHLRKQKEQRMAEINSPTHQLYLKIRDQLLPRDNLQWAREAIISEYQSGMPLSLAVNSARLLKCFTTIHLDETLTEAEKEESYNKTLKEYEASITRHFTVRPNYFEDLLTKFKALV